MRAEDPPARTIVRYDQRVGWASHDADGNAGHGAARGP